jgi:uracil-DNA glycosylase
LIETISIVQPVVVVTLGNFATKFVLNTNRGITSLRGGVYGWHGRKVIPTFHPAAILHGGGEKSRQFVELQDDFALIRRTLDASVRPEPVADGSPGPVAPPAAGPPGPPGPSPVEDEQMELF